MFCGLILYCTVHVPLDTQECSTVSTPNQILYGTLQMASLSRFLKTMPKLIDLLCGTVLTAHTREWVQVLSQVRATTPSIEEGGG